MNLIKKTIILEIERNEFYKLTAAKANSIEVKDALLNLAKEEMIHIEWHHSLFDKIKDDSLDIPSTLKIFIMDLVKDESLNFVISVFRKIGKNPPYFKKRSNTSKHRTG